MLFRTACLVCLPERWLEDLPETGDSPGWASSSCHQPHCAQFQWHHCIIFPNTRSPKCSHWCKSGGWSCMWSGWNNCLPVHQTKDWNCKDRSVWDLQSSSYALPVFGIPVERAANTADSYFSAHCPSDDSCDGAEIKTMPSYTLSRLSASQEAFVKSSSSLPTSQFYPSHSLPLTTSLPTPAPSSSGARSGDILYEDADDIGRWQRNKEGQWEHAP